MPSKNQTFKDYSSEVFHSQIKKHRQNYSAERIDVVFDTYKHESLRAATRSKRGKGARRKVQHDTVVPNNWRAFLRLGENKSELFRYLSNQMATAGLIDQALICAFDDTCFPNNPDIDLTSMVRCNHEEADTRVFLHCFPNNPDIDLTSMVRCNHEEADTRVFLHCFPNNPDIDLTSMVRCNHEEADTRVFLHATNMAENGHQRAVIRTVDTDVLVLAIFTFDKLQSFVEKLWLDFAAGKNRKFYPVDDI